MPNKTMRQRHANSTFDEEFRRSILGEQKGYPLVDAFVHLKGATSDESLSRSKAGLILGSQVARQISDIGLAEKLQEIHENQPTRWLWVRVSFLNVTQRISVQKVVMGIMENLEDLIVDGDTFMCGLPELKSQLTLSFVTAKQKQNIDKLSTIWQSDGRTKAKGDNSTKKKDKGLSVVEYVKRQVTKLTSDERSQIMEAFAKANEAEYQRLLFGNKNPTIVRLNRFLRDHAGEDMENDAKATLARAISLYRKKFNAVLIYENEDGERIPCTLTTAKQYNGDLKRRFALREVGNGRLPVSTRNQLQTLILEQL